MFNLVNNLPILSIIIWLPILSGLLLLFVGKNRAPANSNYFKSNNNYSLIQIFSLIISVVVFAFAIILYVNFDQTNVAMQFQERYVWVPIFNIYYDLAIDGIALALILLTTFFTPIIIMASWRLDIDSLNQYLAAFLILAGIMCGVFAARDAILFYFFWEAMLIPMFLIIGIWGGENRIAASVKFFLYTFLGSILMLVALIYIGTVAGNFNFGSWNANNLGLSFVTQKLIFIALFLAFAVKIPMWPVHSWLPYAHVEAPTAGSVILAAIMLKMGGYGLIRFCLPIVPLASQNFACLIVILSLIAVIYIGLVAIIQKDMKKLIAYSSIAHMGFVTLGIFLLFLVRSDDTTISIMAIEGAMIQMISHGFISGALFLCIGVLYDRMHTRLIDSYGGVTKVMPIFAAFFMVFCMANVGLPGTSGFIGEFLIIISSFQLNFWIAFALATTLILSASFTLWMYKRVMFGPIVNEAVTQLVDLNVREKFTLACLLIPTIYFGIYPKPLVDLMHVSIENLVQTTLNNN